MIDVIISGWIASVTKELVLMNCDENSKSIYLYTFLL